MRNMRRYRSREDPKPLWYQSRIDERDDVLWILYYRGSNDTENVRKTLQYIS